MEANKSIYTRRCEMERILIVDDHIAVAAGTKLMLEKEKNFQVETANSGDDALDLIKKASFDIYIFDLKMPEMNGHDLAKRVIELDPLAKIIIYTGYELEEYFNSLIETGIVGFLSKTDSEEQMMKTIRGLLENDAVIPIHLLQQLRKGNNLFQTMQMKTNLLTEKEWNILEQVAHGKTNIEIADAMFQSPRTIEYHLSSVFKKLEVDSRTAAVVKARELNGISID